MIYCWNFDFKLFISNCNILLEAVWLLLIQFYRNNTSSRQEELVGYFCFSYLACILKVLAYSKPQTHKDPFLDCESIGTAQPRNANMKVWYFMFHVYQVILFFKNNSSWIFKVKRLELRQWKYWYLFNIFLKTDGSSSITAKRTISFAILVIRYIHFIIWV